MYVRELDLKSQDDLNFLDSQGGFFNQPEWLSCYGNQLVVIGLFNNNDEPIGALNLFEFRKFGFTLRIDPPLSYTSAFFLQSEAIHTVSRQTRAKDAMGAIANHLKQEEGKAIAFSLPPHWTDMQPFLHAGFRVQPRYTYLLSLEQTEQDILAGMSPERRRNVQKGKKEGFEVTEVTDSNYVVDFVLPTLHNAGLKYHEDRLRQQVNFALSSGKGIAREVTHQGRPVAMAFCIKDNEKAVYLLGGSNQENTHQSGMSFALWSCILSAREMGCTQFNFAGSMVPAIERFFRGFGGVITPYYAITRAPLLLRLGMALTKRSLM